MSLPSYPSLDLDLRPRRAECRLAVASLVLVAAATGLVLLQPLPPPVIILISVAGMACMALNWLGFCLAGWLNGGRRIVRAHWVGDQPGGSWTLTDAAGREWAAALRADSRVGTGWVWLRWNAEGVRSMLLIHGDVAPAELRRLGVRLRLTGMETAAA